MNNDDHMSDEDFEALRGGMLEILEHITQRNELERLAEQADRGETVNVTEMTSEEYLERLIAANERSFPSDETRARLIAAAALDDPSIDDFTCDDMTNEEFMAHLRGLRLQRATEEADRCEGTVVPTFRDIDEAIAWRKEHLERMDNEIARLIKTDPVETADERRARLLEAAERGQTSYTVVPAATEEEAVEYYRAKRRDGGL